MTVREIVKGYQREIQQTADLLPDRAAELLNKLSSLMGNCLDEIREAEAEYAVTYLHFLDTEKKANRAKIRAEVSPEYRRKREARDTKEVITTLIASLKYFMRSKEEELRTSRFQQ
jgi:hypothetical protein